jgi:hypothetical protein
MRTPTRMKNEINDVNFLRIPWNRQADEGEFSSSYDWTTVSKTNIYKLRNTRTFSEARHFILFERTLRSGGHAPKSDICKSDPDPRRAVECPNEDDKMSGPWLAFHDHSTEFYYHTFIGLVLIIPKFLDSISIYHVFYHNSNESQ